MSIKRRAQIKELLSKLTEQNQQVFKRMYSPNDMSKDINKVVDEMPKEQLKWALTQCENTYHHIFKILKDA